MRKVWNGCSCLSKKYDSLKFIWTQTRQDVAKRGQTRQVQAAPSEKGAHCFKKTYCAMVFTGNKGTEWIHLHASLIQRYLNQILTHRGRDKKKNGRQIHKGHLSEFYCTKTVLFSFQLNVLPRIQNGKFRHRTGAKTLSEPGIIPVTKDWLIINLIRTELNFLRNSEFWVSTDYRCFKTAL